MDFTKKLVDSFTVDGKEYPLRLTVKRVLDTERALASDSIPDLFKGHLVLKILTGMSKEDINALGWSPDEALAVVKAIVGEHIDGRREDVELDRAGNPVVKRKNEKYTGSDKVLDINQDAQYIYASFLQAYGIDLVEQADSLHWEKFTALLASLPKNTKMREIIEIRSWKPYKGVSSSEREHYRQLQNHYKLRKEE